MGICKICGKPTTSHRMGAYFICHTCWETRNDEVKKLKNEIKESVENPLKELKKNERDGIKLIGMIQIFAMGFDEDIKKSLKEYKEKVDNENKFIVFMNWFAFVI